MVEAIFAVSGMTCAACSGSVTNALEASPNVTAASVSLLTNEAKVTFDPPTTPEELIAAIEDSGFDASLVSVSEPDAALDVTILGVSGMTCGACSSSITEMLEGLSGVTSVSVSLLTNSAKVVHDSSVSTDLLISTIENCGFDAVLESTSHGRPNGVRLETRLSVHGMTCGACSASITGALENTPGVVRANVSQLTNAAVVVHEDTVSAEEIKGIIEDCGFDAAVESTSSTSPGLERQPEDVVLQIYGITEELDLPQLQYNVEAVLNSLPGVTEFQFIFKGSLDEDKLASNTADLDPESLVDELHVSLYTNITGLRQLVDSLHTVDSSLQFVISNSVDQSLSSQLKLLSKVKDIQYWRSNFIQSLCFGIPIVILSMTEDSEFWNKLILFHGLYLVSVLELALTSHVLFYLGSIFFKKLGFFLRNKGKNANMDVLVCISTVISYAFSVFSIFLSVWYGQTDKPPKVLFETIAMLICFVSFGKWIENRAKGATSSALSRLMSLTPTTCVIITDDQELEKLLFGSNDEKTEVTADLPTRTISIDLIQENDVAVVSPGSKVPADGQIIYGSTEIDESIITGEALPITKKVGDRVIGGSVNGPYLIYIRVTGAGKSSQLHQIIDIVKESQVNKAPVQRFADYVSARFVACVLCLSLFTLTFWSLMSKFAPEYLPSAFSMDENGKYFVALKLAISVVVVACPCALGLAAPTAVMVGTGVGATHGALIKGGDVLEKASKVNVILFDKTGTLTCGDLSISRAKPILQSSLTEVDWWNLVGSVEVNSEHPAGKAIVGHSRKMLGLTFEEDKFQTQIVDFKVLTGMGVSAEVTVNGASHKIAVGNSRMVVKYFPEARASLAEVMEKDLSNSVSSVSHVVINDQYGGYMELADTIKPCAKDTLDYLQHVQHYQVGMVTGDNKAVADKVGRELGIPAGNIFSEVLPIDKDSIVRQLREMFGGEGNVCIAFVGDGVNDAPALVQADIGMAISTGTDIAIDSAEVVLMGSDERSNDLLGVITALEISEASFRKIKWNFVYATIYNFFMLPFAMGLFLKFNLMLSPVTAAAAMASSSVSVVINSLLLKSWHPPNVAERAREAIYDESADGSDFSLSHSSLADFNAIKRGTFGRRMFKGRFPRWFSRFNGRYRAQRAEYEMVSSSA